MDQTSKHPTRNVPCALRQSCLSLVLTAIALTASPAFADQPPPSVSNLSIQQRADLSRMLKVELQETISKQKRLKGQTASPVEITFGTQDGIVSIELGREFIPKDDHYMSGILEDQLHEIAGTAREILDGNLSFTGTRFTFGGKTIDELFPVNWKPKHLRQGASKSQPLDASAPVVVSAGHGYTKVEGGWGWQRDLINGWREDVDNPYFAEALADQLRTRSAETVVFPRSTSTTINKSANVPWWQMASIYHISRLLPNNRDIWAAFPKDDYKSDIVARPRYARNVNAKAIISLHTDAGGPSATGTTVYYHEGRVASKNLADAIACSMKEIVNATPGYENYTVRSPATSSTEYGENREAVEVPAVIVESGFHTNPTDAVALRDTVFQEAAMKGVEKGYRVSSKGKSCVPQKITSVPKAVANLNGPKLQVPITFVGNPQFPVKDGLINGVGG
ncbi:N-acetylmuramoyl-L-alanine amidase [Xanthomonas campestris]|uniref:N-acetylmuramoyl-L-alanine amidase n=1 Tax=Xanthomonas campestris TaxID=339 RepID=UPI002378807B|nr:N-acetylmuramoyl-L-alanine amidase [Xanthomonas campestris]WDK30237.1 N-acetylmuramoyl-L-alanine amidase [Xanthomonas campestris]